MKAHEALMLTNQAIQAKKDLKRQQQMEYEDRHAEEIQETLDIIYELIRQKAEQGERSLVFLHGQFAKTVSDNCKKLQGVRPQYWSIQLKYGIAIQNRLYQDGFRLRTSGANITHIYWDDRDNG